MILCIWHGELLTVSYYRVKTTRIALAVCLALLWIHWKFISRILELGKKNVEMWTKVTKDWHWLLKSNHINLLFPTWIRHSLDHKSKTNSLKGVGESPRKMCSKLAEGKSNLSALCPGLISPKLLRSPLRSPAFFRFHFIPVPGLNPACCLFSWQNQALAHYKGTKHARKLKARDTPKSKLKGTSLAKEPRTDRKGWWKAPPLSVISLGKILAHVVLPKWCDDRPLFMLPKGLAQWMLNI